MLVAVAEGPVGRRLKVAGVHAPAGHRVAALAHAGVVAQAPFVQVGVGEGIAARDPLSLGPDKRRKSLFTPTATGSIALLRFTAIPPQTTNTN